MMTMVEVMEVAGPLAAVAGHLETKAKAEVELIRAMEVGALGAAAGHLARAMAKVELKKRRQTMEIPLHLLDILGLGA